MNVFLFFFSVRRKGRSSTFVGFWMLFLFFKNTTKTSISKNVLQTISQWMVTVPSGFFVIISNQPSKNRNSRVILDWEVTIQKFLLICTVIYTVAYSLNKWQNPIHFNGTLHSKIYSVMILPEMSCRQTSHSFLHTESIIQKVLRNYSIFNMQKFEKWNIMSIYHKPLWKISVDALTP